MSFENDEGDRLMQQRESFPSVPEQQLWKY